MHYQLDGRAFTDREQTYRYLQEELELPAYFGHNLDALADALFDLADAHIRIDYQEQILDQLGDYGGKLLSVFEEAAANGWIQLELSKEDLPFTLPNGQAIQRMGMGTWKMGEIVETAQDEIAALQYGLDHGLALIDTAEMYGDGLTEELVGQAIANYDREKIYLVSKFLPYHADRHHLQEALEGSLRRLKTDYLDLYLLHWPGSTPLEETVALLEALKEKEKIRHWGVSNFDLEDMQKLWSVERGDQCACNQLLYHIASRGIEYVLKPWQDQRNIMTMAYCPLANGGRMRGLVKNNPSLQKMAEEKGLSVQQIMLAFLLSRDNTMPIPKAGKIEHMKENLHALEIELSDHDLKKIAEIFPPADRRQALDIE